MTLKRHLGIQITGFLLSLLFIGSPVLAANKAEIDSEGMTQFTGSVIASPCSIMMDNRYQTVDFSPLTMTELVQVKDSTQRFHPFSLVLQDCAGISSSIDRKTWEIRFEGPVSQYLHAFVLQGPSQGLGVAVLDNKKSLLVPGESYSLFDSVLRQDKSGQDLFLRYFLQLELTGMPLQAGSYQGFIRFFIDYQ